MHNIVFLDKSAVAPKIHLPKPGFPHQWVEYDYTESEQLVERAKDATVVVTCGAPVRAAELAQLPKLQMVCVAMTGTDHVDVDYCHENGIQVSNVPAYSPATVAEHALGLLLALRRQIVSYHTLLKSNEWYGEDWQTNVFLDYEVNDIHASRIGIVGTGMIGKAMGKMAAGLGMDVVYYNQGKTSSELPLVSFDELLETCDAISLHCPLNSSTRDMFTLTELKRMKKGAVIINAARGGIINESDLAEALRSGVLAGAAVDIVEQDPIRPDEPLLELMELPNFIMTPHVAWSSQQAMQGLMDRAIENINQWNKGTPTNLV
ncbi:NAD(P)-dependent oxidoreductase [Halomonas salifodinae]|uniref:NAD(P)-dependent oxidoreductase n=1 Tax=Halomonas salifodinae TaxID=438745 RepID=A0ABW2F0S9_9GAMM